jgi:hypothetical protein
LKSIASTHPLAPAFQDPNTFSTFESFMLFHQADD